jgi:hypothetical protein
VTTVGPLSDDEPPLEESSFEDIPSDPVSSSPDVLPFESSPASFA